MPFYDFSHFAEIIYPDTVEYKPNEESLLHDLLEGALNKPVKYRAYILPEVRMIRFDGRTTVVVWDDGTSTVVRCSEEDKPSKYHGFAVAVCKKIFGSNSAIKDLIEHKDEANMLEQKAKEREERAKKQHEAEEKAYERKIKKMAQEIIDKKKAQNLADLMTVDSFFEKIVRAVKDSEGDGK